MCFMTNVEVASRSTLYNIRTGTHNDVLYYRQNVDFLIKKINIKILSLIFKKIQEGTCKYIPLASWQTSKSHLEAF